MLYKSPLFGTKNLIIITIIMFLVFFISCAKIYNKNEFNLINEIFTIHPNLRIDGFYYDTITIPEHNSPKYPRKIGIKPMVMFGDGTVFKMDGVYTRPWFRGKPVDPLIEDLIMEVKYDIQYNQLAIKVKPDIWDWGMYRIKENEIWIQAYRNFQGDYFLTDYNGKIVNDTTIQLRTVKMRTRNNYDINKIEDYKFVKFSVKPDSNNYIKFNFSKFGKMYSNKT